MDKFRITDGQERGVFRTHNFFNLSFHQPYNLLFGKFDSGHQIRLSPICKAPPAKETDTDIASNAPDGVWIAVGYFVVLVYKGQNVGCWYADNLTDAIEFYESAVDADKSTFTTLVGSIDIHDFLIPMMIDNEAPPAPAAHSNLVLEVADRPDDS